MIIYKCIGQQVFKVRIPLSEIFPVNRDLKKKKGYKHSNSGTC